MLGNREIGGYAKFGHHDMASNLPSRDPSLALEGFDRLLARDVRQRTHYTATSIGTVSFGSWSRAF
jgi:hypothetical protein